jgi:signal transduction histidine kinase
MRTTHVLFGFFLAALIALCVWWMVFFFQTIELEKRANLAELTTVAMASAMILGLAEQPPVLGLLPEPAGFEVVPITEDQTGKLVAACVPRYPEFGVRPVMARTEVIENRLTRRRFMFIGEGVLLFVLLAICVFMLFRMVSLERIHKKRMKVFLSTVTHEMKTPLTGLKSMLQTFHARKVPEDQKPKLYSLGLKEVERLEHMVQNILLAGRLRTKHYQVRTEALALKATLKAFLEHRQAYLLEKENPFVLEWLAQDELMVLADANGLHVVLENLVDNAIKYGGRNPQVKITAWADSSGVHLVVSDQGVGFSSGMNERLFDAFNPDFDASRHGTGLGLSIARALVRRMGGELIANSEGLDKGSCLTVTLLAADESSPEVASVDLL